MDAVALERGLAEIRQEMQKLRESMTSAQLPVVLDFERAAHELSISDSKLRRMRRAGLIQSVLIGSTPMIPASEIYRLGSLPDSPTPRSKTARVANKEVADKIRALTKKR